MTRMFKGDGPLAVAERESEQAQQQGEREARLRAMLERYGATPERVKQLTDAHGGAIERALEAFHEELDTIALSKSDLPVPAVVSSRLWIEAVRAVLGDVLEGYKEWMREVWEPLDECESADTETGR